MKSSTKRKRKKDLSRNFGAVEYNEWMKEFNRVFNSRLDKDSADRSIVQSEKKKNVYGTYRTTSR